MSIGMELAPYSPLKLQANAGCQGFFGPFPSAFLDKRCCKNCGKDNAAFSIFPNPLGFF
jgi:hypothetical protein